MMDLYDMINNYIIGIVLSIMVVLYYNMNVYVYVLLISIFLINLLRVCSKIYLSIIVNEIFL